jgi:hypothetical protein
MSGARRAGDESLKLKMEIKHLGNCVVLIILLAACTALAQGQETGCSASSVKVPESLARQLLRQALKLMETPTDEQAQVIREAEGRKGGAATLFCGEAVRLDADARPDLLIHQADVEGAFCGAHNCPVWAYRQTGEGYKLLLETIGGYLGPIEALRTSTNGYRDLKTLQQSSAVEHESTIFKFDGKLYRARVCVTETYVEKTRGRGRFKYTRHSCEQ